MFSRILNTSMDISQSKIQEINTCSKLDKSSILMFNKTVFKVYIKDTRKTM